MLTGDVTSTEMCFQIEQAILALASCMKTRSLDRDGRRHLLLSVDLLTSVWSDLQHDEEIPAGEASRLRALIALCEMTAACEDDEAPLVLRAMYRMVEGWTVAREMAPSLPASSQGAAEEPVAWRNLWKRSRRWNRCLLPHPQRASIEWQVWRERFLSNQSAPSLLLNLPNRKRKRRSRNPLMPVWRKREIGYRSGWRLWRASWTM